MLEITLSLEQSEILPYCRKCKKPFSPAFYLYTATDRGEIVAAGLFEVGGDQAEALYYEAVDPGDHILFDAVLRAGLNYAGEQGIPNGFISDQFHERHAAKFSKLNFPMEPRFGITNFFQKYKNCTTNRNYT